MQNLQSFRPRGCRTRKSAAALAVIVLLLSLLLPSGLPAQTPSLLPPGGLVQLQVTQAPVDVASPVTAVAWFDPRVVRAGEKTCYRVNVDATESSIQWPDELPASAGLPCVAIARGQMTEIEANGFRPFSEFVYAAQTAATGQFSVTNFTILVSGVPVPVPAAGLEVLPADAAATATLPAARRLSLEISATNLFLGQPFTARVTLPVGPDNQYDSFHETQLNGDGLMTDKTVMRQYFGAVNVAGQLKTAFICELMVTPIAAGPQKFSAQGFIAGGPARYLLLVSDPVEIKVRPLPVEGELPGFTGAMGKFFSDAPQLSANRLHVGEPARLKLTFHGQGDFSRLAPPAAPISDDWEVIADPPPATSFTLIPLNSDVHETPAIPFSYFDPHTAQYVDLTVPPLPVTVIGESLPVELSGPDHAGETTPLKLTALATVPGRTVTRLQPLPLRAWFICLQLAVAAGFLVLWQGDRRRRFLAAHPDLVRRRLARQALRREQRRLQAAAAAGDTTAYVRHAARALSIAVAPHFPAEPRALVGSDVLSQLDDAARRGPAGETVKSVFAAAAAQYATAPPPPPDLSALRLGVAAVLQQLEEKL